jgi:hypothetical protein
MDQDHDGTQRPAHPGQHHAPERHGGHTVWLAHNTARTASLVARPGGSVRPLGPFPDLYDPVWFPEKLWAAFGERAAGIACLAGIPLGSIRAGRERSDRTACPRSSHRRFPRRR